MKKITYLVFALLAMLSFVSMASAQEAIDPFQKSEFSSEFWTAFKEVAKTPVVEQNVSLQKNKSKLSTSEQEILSLAFDRNISEENLHKLKRLSQELWANGNPRGVNTEEGLMAWQIPWHVHLKAVNVSSVTSESHTFRGGEEGPWNKRAREQALFVQVALEWIQANQIKVVVREVNGKMEAMVSEEDWETPAGKSPTDEVRHILNTGPYWPAVLMNTGTIKRNRTLGEVKVGNFTYAGFPLKGKSERQKLSAPLWVALTTTVIPAGKVVEDKWQAPTYEEAMVFGFRKANPLAQAETATPAVIKEPPPATSPKPQEEIPNPPAKTAADTKLAETQAQLAAVEAKLREFEAKLAEAQKPKPVEVTPEPKVEPTPTPAATPQPKQEQPKPVEAKTQVKPEPKVEPTPTPAQTEKESLASAYIALGVILAFGILGLILFQR